MQLSSFMGSSFPLVLVPRYKLSLCHTPIKPDLLGFPGIDVFACGLRDHVITRFTSLYLVANNCRQQLWMKVAAVLFCISSLQPFLSSLAEAYWALIATINTSSSSFISPRIQDSDTIQARSNSDFDIKCAAIQFYGNTLNSQSDRCIELKFYVESTNILSYHSKTR
jgi:hypothetical protein